jgi:hypothetical protein
MFIIRNRAIGAVAGLACAVLVTLFLGGCAAPLNHVADDGPKVCERYGPGANDRRCGDSQVHKAESLLGGMVR